MLNIQPPIPVKARGRARVLRGPHNTLDAIDQEECETDAASLRTLIGLTSSNEADHFEGITIADAHNYIRKTVHEMHQAVLNETEPPTVEAICRHLGLMGQPVHDAATPEKQAEQEAANQARAEQYAEQIGQVAAWHAEIIERELEQREANLPIAEERLKARNAKK